jgi:N-methylhydantoinase A
MIKIATDAGGTFTDLVAFEETTGKIYLGKVLTTPKDPSRGVIESIDQSRETGLVTNAVSFFVHGGTTVINALTERKGARTALVTTDGFRDLIAIGRGNRPDLYNLHSKPPEPFVPRHLRFEVIERMDARGNVRRPLSVTSLDAAAEAIAAAGVEAVAVIFLHAYINPAHEAVAAARLRELLPGIAVTASHEISRQWREYERSNTAVLSAYVQPIIAHYLANLSRALAEKGVACPCYCMQSSGGLAEFDEAKAAPLVLVESGPAGGVAGSVRIGEAISETEIL